MGIKAFSKTRLRRDVIYSFEDLLGKRTPDTNCQINKASRTYQVFSTAAIFRRSHLRISTLKSAIMAQKYRVYSQFFQASRIKPWQQQLKASFNRKLTKEPCASPKCHSTKSIIKPVACGFGGLEVACWPMVPKFAGSNRSRRIFQGEKILSTPSFGREVKPFVPCRRFTACKRSLKVT